MRGIGHTVNTDLDLSAAELASASAHGRGNLLYRDDGAEYVRTRAERDETRPRGQKWEQRAKIVGQEVRIVGSIRNACWVPDLHDETFPCRELLPRPGVGCDAYKSVARRACWEMSILTLVLAGDNNLFSVKEVILHPSREVLHQRS